MALLDPAPVPFCLVAARSHVICADMHFPQDLFFSRSDCTVKGTGNQMHCQRYGNLKLDQILIYNFYIFKFYDPVFCQNGLR